MTGPAALAEAVARLPVRDGMFHKGKLAYVGGGHPWPADQAGEIWTWVRLVRGEVGARAIDARADTTRLSALFLGRHDHDAQGRRASGDFQQTVDIGMGAGTVAGIFGMFGKNREAVGRGPGI